jgi:hypothetical protein
VVVTEWAGAIGDSWYVVSWLEHYEGVNGGDSCFGEFFVLVSRVTGRTRDMITMAVGTGNIRTPLQPFKRNLATSGMPKLTSATGMSIWDFLILEVRKLWIAGRLLIYAGDLCDEVRSHFRLIILALGENRFFTNVLGINHSFAFGFTIKPVNRKPCFRNCRNDIREESAVAYAIGLSQRTPFYSKTSCERLDMR